MLLLLYVTIFSYPHYDCWVPVWMTYSYFRVEKSLIQSSLYGCLPYPVLFFLFFVFFIDFFDSRPYTYTPNMSVEHTQNVCWLSVTFSRREHQFPADFRWKWKNSPSSRSFRFAFRYIYSVEFIVTLQTPQGDGIFGFELPIAASLRMCPLYTLKKAGNLLRLVQKYVGSGFCWEIEFSVSKIIVLCLQTDVFTIANTFLIIPPRLSTLSILWDFPLWSVTFQKILFFSK